MRLPRSVLLFSYILFGLFVGFLVTNYARVLYDLRIMHQVVLSIIVGAWLLVRWRRGNGLPQSPLILPLLLLIGWWLITALLGIYPRMSLERAWNGISMTLLFFGLLELMRYRQQRRLVIEATFAVAMVILVVSLFELSARAFGMGILPNSQYGWFEYGFPVKWPNIILAQPNSNMLAGFCVVMGLISFGWGMSSKGIGRYALWLLSFLFVLCLPATTSRAGYVALGVGIITLCLFWAWRLPLAQRISVHTRSRLVTTVGILSVTTALIAIPLLLSNRADLWGVALDLFGNDPIPGIGYGAFGHAMRNSDLRLLYEGFDHAHNLFINHTVETGLIGLALVLWAGVGLVRSAIRHWQQTSGKERIKLQAAIAALVAYGFHNLADCLTNPTLVLLLAVLIAYVAIEPAPIVVDEKTTTQSIHPIWRWAPAGLAGLLAVYLVALMPIHQATKHYLASLRADDSNVALQEIQEAQILDPALVLYQMQEAYFLGLLAQKDETVRSEALAAYEIALQGEETWVIGWLNYAALLEAGGQIDEALTALEEAAQFDASGAAWLHWARLSEQYEHGEDEAVIQAYVNGMAEELPLSSFWQQTPLRQQAVERFATEQDTDIQYRIWQAHDPSRLADIVPQNPQSAGDYWIVGQWALSQGDNQAAYDAFTEAIERNNAQGDYYVSRAMSLSSPTPELEHDLVQAQWIGGYYTSPYLVRARWTDDPYERLDNLLAAVPSRLTNQYISFIIYDRVGNLDTLPQMRLPGPSDEALQPAFEALPILEAAGQENTARALWRQVLDVAPFDARVQTMADELGVD